jgi:hypothetical protein
MRGYHTGPSPSITRVRRFAAGQNAGFCNPEKLVRVHPRQQISRYMMRTPMLDLAGETKLHRT